MVARTSASAATAWLARAVYGCGSFEAASTPPDGPDAATADDASDSDAGSSDGSSDGRIDATPTRSAAYEALVLRDAPLAYWRFGEGSGVTTKSIVGDQHVLVVQENGPTFETTGLFGPGSHAMRFDGSTATALADESTRRVPAVGPARYAFEVWIDIPTTDTAERWLIVQTASTNRYGIALDSTGLRAETVQGTAVYRVLTNTSLAPGFHHVVATRDTPSLTLWVDGKSYTTASTSTGSSQSFTPSLFVGGSAQSSGLLPAGARIAEVAIYDGPLTDVQVAEHFAAGKPSL